MNELQSEVAQLNEQAARAESESTGDAALSLEQAVSDSSAASMSAREAANEKSKQTFRKTLQEL
jgi:hypothetical protein